MFSYSFLNFGDKGSERYMDLYAFLTFNRPRSLDIWIFIVTLSPKN